MLQFSAGSAFLSHVGIQAIVHRMPAGSNVNLASKFTEGLCSNITSFFYLRLQFCFIVEKLSMVQQ